MRTAPDRRTALEAVAAAIEQRLIGERTTSERLTVAKLFGAVEQLTDDERTRAIEAAGVRASALVARLDGGARRRLVKQLRALA